MKEEAEELARLGCRYIQVDAPDFGQLVDQAQRDSWEQAGISVDRVFSEGADMLNELALSTQCGFASAGPGNAISEGAQENKLRLVGEVADRVWRTGG